MDTGDERGEDLQVLRNKRDATRYQILVQIAERQPAVNQAEIADPLDVTPQAVSEYLNDLVEKGHVKKLGRGRWEITTEGVDWLISQTDDLREYTRYVWEEVIEQGGVESAVATTAISEGDRVTLSMEDGTLRAESGDAGPATATAVTDAEPGVEVGVTDFKGILDFEVGHVTVFGIPSVQDGGSQARDAAEFLKFASDHELVAVAGTEALVAAETAGVTPDLRFGTPDAIQEAALKGLSVLLLAVTHDISRHTDRLREYDIPYEVVDDGE